MTSRAASWARFIRTSSKSQLFLGTQVMDESRHEDVFRKRALVNGGGLVDAGFGASHLLTADDFTEMTARLHLVGEGFVQTIFRMGELISNNDAEKRIFRLAAQDESRHLAFGVTHLKYLMDVEPGAQGRAAPLPGHPGRRARPVAGQPDDEPGDGRSARHPRRRRHRSTSTKASQKLMIMRKKQINEYMHRLEVIGLGDRRERMAPAMKVFLEA